MPRKNQELLIQLHEAITIIKELRTKLAGTNSILEEVFSRNEKRFLNEFHEKSSQGMGKSKTGTR